MVIGLCGITSDILATEEIKQEKGKVNKDNASKLWKIIQEAGDYLLG